MLVGPRRSLYYHRMTTLPMPAPADLAFVLAVLLAMHLSRRLMPLYALLVLPGTLLHELAHWLIGWLLGARPGRLQLMPRRGDDRRWRLGAVGFRRVRGFNAAPIALAPLLLLPLAWLLYRVAIAEPIDAWTHWAALYAATAAAVSCLPSTADWRLAASRPFGTALYALLLATALAWTLLH
jgi:hypothetical protein